MILTSDQFEDAWIDRIVKRRAGLRGRARKLEFARRELAELEAAPWSFQDPWASRLGLSDNREDWKARCAAWRRFIAKMTGETG